MWFVKYCSYFFSFEVKLLILSTILKICGKVYGFWALKQKRNMLQVFIYFTEPIRRVPLTTQGSQESGTVVMDTPMTTSIAAKKTNTGVLFTLEGMELLLQNETDVRCLIVSMLHVL